MVSRDRIEVLSSCRDLLKFMGLCSKTNYQFYGWKLPNFLVFCAFSIPYIYSIPMHVLAIYDLGLDIKNSSAVLLTLVATIQMQLIYISLAYNNDIIIETFDHIQKIVDRSK